MRRLYEKFIKFLVGRTKWKIPLGSPGHRQEDNIKMDLREVGCDNVYCIHVAQDRV
jgi:hypothetical protein